MPDRHRYPNTVELASMLYTGGLATMIEPVTWMTVIADMIHVNVSMTVIVD